MEEQKQKELVITRVFDAPRELVWRMWSEPELLKKWHGPKDFTCPVSTIDFRVGGKYHHCMRGKDTLPPEMAGKDFWSTGTYKEIIPPDPSNPSGQAKIVATDSFADAAGNIVSASTYGMEGFPDELEVTLVFEELPGNKTKMTLIHRGIEKVDEKMVKNMHQGWNESLDKMVENLE